MLATGKTKIDMYTLNGIRAACGIDSWQYKLACYTEQDAIKFEDQNWSLVPLYLSDFWSVEIE